MHIINKNEKNECGCVTQTEINCSYPKYITIRKQFTKRVIVPCKRMHKGEWKSTGNVDSKDIMVEDILDSLFKTFQLLYLPSYYEMINESTEIKPYGSVRAIKEDFKKQFWVVLKKLADVENWEKESNNAEV